MEYNANCAATIQKNNLDWEKIKGIQIKGNIEIAKDNYWEEYLNEFDYISKSNTLKEAMKKVKLYKLKIEWTRFIDNTKGFGNKNEIKYS